MKTYKYPDFFARFYDLIYKQHMEEIDYDFFLNEMLKPNETVLDLGAGTGRLFLDALSKGANVYALDLSQPMLDILLEKLNPQEHFRVSMQNASEFKIPLKFNTIVAPFRVFMHLLTTNDQLKTLNNVYDHLEKDGVFIFDTFIPDPDYLKNGLDNHTDFEAEYEPGKMFKRIASTKPDLVNQLINITFKFEWEENNKIQKKVWKVPLRFFFQYELQYLIQKSKFKNKFNIYGDYMKNPLNSESKTFIVECKK